MLKDIISFVECNNLVNTREYAWGGLVVAPIFFVPYPMIDVLGGLGVDMGWLLGASLVCGRLRAPSCACDCLFPNLLLSICNNA